jgi:ATP-dependent DNA helicase RecG
MLSEKLTKTLLRTTDNYIKALEKAWILTIGDFLWHFPRDYEDRTNVLDSFSLINIKERNTILVKLLSINSQKTANNKLLTKAVLEDKNGFLSEAVWFNRKYLASQLQISVWKEVIISWKVKYTFGKVTFQSPEVETDLEKLNWEIVPIYPDLNYIPSKWIEGKIEILEPFIKEIPEDLPEEIIKKYNFISKRDAVHRIHFPKNKLEIEEARHRLAYWELWEINFRAIGSKLQNFKDSEGRSLAIPFNPEKVKELLAFFPFQFTDQQKIALFQILKDMEKPHAMQRLLEWDVGTGKTAVAFVAGVYGILESGKI